MFEVGVVAFFEFFGAQMDPPVLIASISAPDNSGLPYSGDPNGTGPRGTISSTVVVTCICADVSLVSMTVDFGASATLFPCVNLMRGVR